MVIDRTIATARRIGARVSTVRAGTTALATVIVAITLAFGAIALLAVLRGTLIDEVAEAARLQALEVARQIESGRQPNLEVAGSDEQLIQVVGPDGSVLASSRNVAGDAAVARLRPGESEQILTPLDNEDFMAVAEGAQASAGPRTILVARALLGVFETTALVTQVLIVGLPLLLVVVADHSVGDGWPSARPRRGDTTRGRRDLGHTAAPPCSAAGRRR